MFLINPPKKHVEPTSGSSGGSHRLESTLQPQRARCSSLSGVVSFVETETLDSETYRKPKEMASGYANKISKDNGVYIYNMFIVVVLVLKNVTPSRLHKAPSNRVAPKANESQGWIIRLIDLIDLCQPGF